VKRASRRHHKERVKAKWKRRVRREHGPSLEAWKAPPPAQAVEARAVRLAHHNKCACDGCRRPRYERPAPGAPPREGEG
jgi:hypothetical protein